VKVTRVAEKSLGHYMKAESEDDEFVSASGLCKAQ
jgi:hypothetical protein